MISFFQRPGEPDHNFIQSPDFIIQLSCPPHKSIIYLTLYLINHFAVLAVSTQIAGDDKQKQKESFHPL
jgi:hypothetical protein